MKAAEKRTKFMKFFGHLSNREKTRRNSIKVFDQVALFVDTL